MVTNTLYEFAETNTLLSTTQAGFRKQKDTIHQLQNIIMALEDAKLFKQDVYALIVDFTSAFNTTDHDRMLWIMYDMGFPTDAIDVVKNLYQQATTQVHLPTARLGIQTRFLLKEAPYKGTPCHHSYFSCTWNPS